MPLRTSVAPRFTAGILLASLIVYLVGCGGGGAQSSPPISVSLDRTTITLAPGNTAQFTATVNNDPNHQGVTWTVSCSAPACGTASPTTTASGAATTYTAPASAPASNLAVTLTATSISDGAQSSSATITVPAAGTQVTVSVTPDSITVQLGAHADYTATVLNDTSNRGVTWQLMQTVNGSLVPCTSAAVCGTISATSSASGVPINYTAPTTPPAGNFEVGIVATSIADPAAIGQAFATIPGIIVAVDPANATVEAGSTQQFTATVSNDSSNSGVSWSLAADGVACSPGCGTIKPASTASGAAATYTAPATPPPSDLSVTVNAASVFLSAATGSATVTVPAIVVSVAPGGALLPLNTTQQFTATVRNDPSNAGVTWQLTQNGAACPSACGTFAPSATASGTATTYTPPGAVPSPAAVTFLATSVADTTKTASATVTLTAGTVKIVPNTLNFGQVLVGTVSTPKNVAVTNTGSGALSVSGVSITGGAVGSFSQTNTCVGSLASMASCTVSGTFKPQRIGLVSATISIADSSSDSPQQIIVSGTGYTRRIYNQAAALANMAGLGTVASPTPTGPETVGTRTLDLVDRARRDPYRGSGNRELLVRLWYPASLRQPCQPADYAAPQVWSYISQLLGITLPQVTTNSCLDAPVKDGAHPLVIFTPGYTGTSSDYTFIFEDLASRGYVIASVDHTYEATAVAFPDGRLVKSILGSHFDNSWRGDDRTLTLATAVRLQDVSFLRAELRRQNAKRDSFLAGRLDMSRVAIAGHSMGGAAALMALQKVAHLKAGIIIDGHLPPEFLRPTATPVLMLGGGTSWSEDQCRAWSSLRGERVAVNFSGGEHVMFSDLLWLARGAIQTGAMGPDQTAAAVRDYIAAFLDASLRGRGTVPLLSGRSAVYPHAAVTTHSESLCAGK